jgi:asparaginyl-tRNA synthetase
MITIREILNGKEGKESIHGWLHNKRSSGGILFLEISDGTGFIQSTVRKDKLSEKKFEEIERLPLQSVIEISGEAKKDPRAPGGYEVVADEVKIEHESAEDYPIGKKFHGPEFLLDQRHFWLRNQKMQITLRIKSEVLKFAREWLDKNGYTEFHSPIFTAAACEGGSTLFQVKYFDREVFLTQSWQLYAEAAIASLGKIYTIAPSFRAEKSRTRRHLTEYWHMEVEEPWCDLECIMKTEEELVSFICQKIAEKFPEELKLLGRDPKDLLKVKPPFSRIKYDEAIEILQKEKVKIKWSDDITWENDKLLSNKFDKPFFLSHFPKGIKAFYHKPDPKNPKVTLSVDLMGPEGYGELTGGGQRIHDLDELLKRMKEEKMKTKEYQWYIDLRKYGTVPHSGFGLGVERLVSWVCKLQHIRDAIAFPRMINRVYP